MKLSRRGFLAFMGAVPAAAIVPFKPKSPAVIPKEEIPAAMTRPNIEVALFRLEGEDAVEVSGWGYTRQPVTFERDDESLVNSHDIIWNEAENNWGDIHAFGLVDGHNGKLLAMDYFDNCSRWRGKSVSVGDTVKMPEHDLAIYLHDPWGGTVEDKFLENALIRALESG